MTAAHTTNPGLLRRLIPALVAPLTVACSVLAALPWLRSFPLSVIGVPLFAAAVISVLVPLATARGVRTLWIGALIDVIVFVIFTLLVVLHAPLGFGQLVRGLYHGPSQLLTFAVPLVSPRSLMVPPVALTWLAGAVAGQCLARRWISPVPYGGFLVAFVLTYAATVRGAAFDTGSVQLRQTLYGALLLLGLLLLRACQTWARQNEDAEQTQPDGVLPLRGIAAGVGCAAVVAVAAALLVQTGPFDKQPVTPQRVPAINNSEPLSPISFIRSLRPDDPRDAGEPAFTVRTNAETPGYIDVANLDFYDGAGWNFDRTFRPSGGELPADTDLSLAADSVTVTQGYTINGGPLTSAPWMPFVYRPQKVDDVSVNADPSSGMIVPAGGRLPATAEYLVRSSVPSKTFAQLPATATPDTLTPATNVQLPGELSVTLNTVVKAFADETGVPTTPAVPFLLALQRDLRTRYSLPGTPAPTSAATSAAASPSATAPPAGARAGSTGFADVVASIMGANRSGTPEQYATLVALVARQLGVPARIATGFRVAEPGHTLSAGSHQVSTAQAWTWVETPIVGEGWVVLDAAPGQYGSPQQQPSVGATTSPLPTATPTQNTQLEHGNNGNAVAPKSTVPNRETTSHNWVIGVVIAAVVLLIAALLGAALLRKPTRARARRREDDPRARVLGAWAESIDRLTEAGLPPLDSLTNTEIAAVAREQFGDVSGEAAGVLGHAATAVVYSSRTDFTDEDAANAWRTERLLRREVRRNLSVGGRIAAALRYHRTRPPASRLGPQSWAAEQTAAPPHRRWFPRH